jgi:hypothetical protein
MPKEEAPRPIPPLAPRTRHISRELDPNRGSIVQRGERIPLPSDPARRLLSQLAVGETTDTSSTVEEYMHRGYL